MASISGHDEVLSTLDGRALGITRGHELTRPRVVALLAGSAVACLAALLMAGLLASTAPIAGPAALRSGVRSYSPAGLPLGLAAAASVSIGASEQSFWPVHRGGALITDGGGIHSRFTAAGAGLEVGGATVSLSLAGTGRGAHVDRLGPVAPTRAASQVVYRYGPISEFYRNGPYGLEQSFSLSERPHAVTAGNGSLVLAVKLGGSLIARQAGSQISFRTRTGSTLLRYGQLSALDATGRRLPARMQLHRGVLQLQIDDNNARYPLRIDPFFQQGKKLTGGGETGKGFFGTSVALSADGNTALIGGPFDNLRVGAAWVFTRSGETWTQQGPKLVAKAGEESGEGKFGGGVALSSDGNTALIGAGSDTEGAGAAWVFTRSVETWTQQGPKLVAKAGEEIGKGHFGFRVALSKDGNTALIGASGDNTFVGAAWVFTRSVETWTQQGPKLVAKAGEEIGEGEFGDGVALSGDGNTALIGGGVDNKSVGAAWVFTRSAEIWTQQGSKITAAEEIGEGRFGFNVALSEDGNTALIGGGADNKSVGAAWVFTRSVETWTQQGKKLTAKAGEEIGEGHFGYAVALSGDGNTALIGAHNDHNEVGAAWAFTRSVETWTQLGSKITAAEESGKAHFGSSVALSANGGTALIGGAEDATDNGAVWPFTNVEASPPTVVTGGASSITQTSAILNATVNPNGIAVTDCHFEYGTTIPYTSNVPCASLPGAGITPVAVSASAGSLAEHTTYHFRISATNSAGTAVGGDQTFATGQAPEYGRCVKLATGIKGLFSTSNCTSPATSEKFSYEWHRGPGAKAKFTTKIKEATTVLLETVVPRSVKLTCKTESGAGEYSGTKQVANVVFNFTGCESGGQKCTTPGGLLEGELETKKLEGILGWEAKATKKVALDLYPVGKTGAVVEYKCIGGVPITVEGSLLAPVTSNKMQVTTTVKYTQTKGIQKPEHFEGEPKDVLTASLNGGEAFEQLGVALTVTQTSEESIEINPVV